MAMAQTPFSFTSDNDGALYVGNASGSNLRLIAQQTTAWNVAQTTGTFTLNPGEDYLYLVGLNYGHFGDLGGYVNGTFMTSVGGWQFKDVSLSDHPGSAFSGIESYNSNLSEVQSLIGSGGFSTNPATISGFAPGSFGGYVSNGFYANAPTFVIPSGNTTRILRQQTSAFGISASSAAPEPGTLALGLLGAGALSARRRSKSRPS